MTTQPNSDQANPDLPKLDGVLNFREMGGLAGAGGTIRHGLIFRSGHLATATDADLTKLAALDIGSIVDFRLGADKAGDGGDDRVPPGAALHEMPMTDPGGRGEEIRETLLSGDPNLMQERYGDGKAHALATEGAATQASDPVKHAIYAKFLDHVADAERPVLFHCSAGKDRAGWAATVLGMALGVSKDDLIDHYLLSNVHRNPEERRAYYESRGVNVDLVMPFLGVHRDFISAALAFVDKNFADSNDYLARALNFGPERVEQLRNKLLV